ncbi:MAG: two-component regulator propeller domain-containing protein [Bacteroidota bacterium]
MSFRMALLLLSTMFFSCNSKKIPASDLPPGVYTEPQMAPLQLQNKYTINPFTGDSIKPDPDYRERVNHPTGIEIPAFGELMPPDSIGQPITVDAGNPFVIAADTNVHIVSQQLQTIPVNESQLKRKKAGPGKTVAANGIVTPVIQPEPVEAIIPGIKGNAKYHITHIDESNGLPSPMVNCVFEDKEGNLWLGMVAGGVVKYDGKSFTQYKSREGFQKSTSTKLLHNVQTIAGDSKGNIWFGGRYGITKYDGKSFTNFPGEKSSLLRRTLPAFADSTGNMWFMAVEGITKYDGKFFTHFTIDDGIQNEMINSICMDRNRNIWISAENGLSRFDGKEFTYFTKADGLPGDIVYGANCDNEGNIWISTNGGLAKYDGRNFTYITRKDGLISEELVHSLQDTKGNHWFTSSNGIAKYDGKSFTSITKNEGLAGNMVFNLIEDKEGGIWVPLQFGISRIDGSGRTFYNATNLPEIESSGSLAGETNGAIWMRSGLNGILRYDGTKFNHFTIAQGLLSNNTDHITIDGNNNVSIITPDGMCFFDGKKFSHYPGGLFKKRVLSTLTDTRGNTWFGFAKSPDGPGLVKFDGKSYTRFDNKSGLMKDLVGSLFEDSKGNIWIAYGSAGVTKYDGKNFTHYTQKEGLPDDRVNKVAEDSDGNIWFANYGLTKFDGKGFTWFSEQQGIDKNYISILEKYGNSGFLVGTEQGMSVINFFDTAASMDGSNLLQTPHTFHTFPIPGYLKNSSLFASLLLTSDNQLWKADGRDLVKQDMNFFDISAPLPAARLNSIGINGNFYDFHNLSDSLKNGISFTETEKFYNYPLNPALSFENNFISFNYVAIEWKAIDNIKYSYKMEGLDDSWSIPSDETKADFRNLPSGKYVFRVCAIGTAQQWGKPFSYAFTILPPWYATWWAYTLYILGFLAALLLFSKFRTQKLKRENLVLEEKVTIRTADLKQKSQELEKSLQELHNAQGQLIQEENSKAILKERMRVSSELHDEVGATLSGIAMYSHLTKEQIKINNISGVENSLSVMQQSSSQMVDKLNDIVWFINPDQDTLKQLVNRLEDYAISMAAIKGIKVKIQVPSEFDDLKMTGENRRNIYLFCKEAINNAVKYSDATNLELIISETDGKMQFSIKDDGKGFDEVLVRRGNGLENMQKRADEIGARLLLQSKINGGVSVSMLYQMPGDDAS